MDSHCILLTHPQENTDAMLQPGSMSCHAPWEAGAGADASSGSRAAEHERWAADGVAGDLEYDDDGVMLDDAGFPDDPGQPRPTESRGKY